jgi:hypothetical protein
MSKFSYAYTLIGATRYIDRSDNRYYNLNLHRRGWELAPNNDPVKMDHRIPDTLLHLLRVSHE